LECGKTTESKKWADAALALGDFHTKAVGTLMLDTNYELSTSHRHLSNIIGIYPFNLINTESGKKDQEVIGATLRSWDKLGTRAWVGYSFSWMSCLRARVGDGEAAVKNLDIFVKAFVLRNGFHANGDQTKSGYSGFTYRPFTLEGNFLASQAVHEMLLQSWSATPGEPHTGVIRIFPAVPQKWDNVSFSNLRAEGGYMVSGIRKNKSIFMFSITAGKSGKLRIKDNFMGKTPKWNVKNVNKADGVYEVYLNKGQKLTAEF